MAEPLEAARARLARSFGRIATAYDDARPDYPLDALVRAEEVLGLAREARVVDLGAGTGKLTRRLLERFDEVVAVEPDAHMRAVLEATTPRAVSLAGTAEALPLADGSAAAVFVADAFHWFDGAVALREIARVLEPGGGLVLLWNDWWSDSSDGTTDELDPPLPPAARAVLDAAYRKSGRATSRRDPGEIVAPFADSPFGPLHEEAFAGELHVTPDALTALYASVSAVASLPDAEREELMRDVRALLAGTYRLALTTELLWTRLK